jgi:hypothetical protein
VKQQSAERVQDFYAGFQKIAPVACDNRQAVSVGDGGDLAVESGDHVPCRIPFCFKLAPDMGGTRGKGEVTGLSPEIVRSRRSAFIHQNSSILFGVGQSKS